MIVGSIKENTTAVYNFSADEYVVWSLDIEGDEGEDTSLFSIDTSTGALSFTSAPDYDFPRDSDSDNEY